MQTVSLLLQSYILSGLEAGCLRQGVSRAICYSEPWQGPLCSHDVDGCSIFGVPVTFPVSALHSLLYATLCQLLVLAGLRAHLKSKRILCWDLLITSAKILFQGSCARVPGELENLKDSTVLKMSASKHTVWSTGHICSAHAHDLSIGPASARQPDSNSACLWTCSPGVTLAHLPLASCLSKYFYNQPSI